jgi:hypothetical protein
MYFCYQPPRHIQKLEEHHIADRVEFCRHLLANPGWLGLIHFSDESRFILGADKRCEQALTYDTEQMLSICERMRNQEPIPELCGEERAV